MTSPVSLPFRPKAYISIFVLGRSHPEYYVPSLVGRPLSRLDLYLLVNDYVCDTSVSVGRIHIHSLMSSSTIRG